MRVMHARVMVVVVVVGTDEETLVPLVETVIHHSGAQCCSHARARTPNTRIMPRSAGLTLLV